MKTLEMSVGNMGFLLDRLGADCGQLQHIRELTQNAIEAVQRTGKPGSVSWQRVPPNLEKDPNLKDKICIIDTGDGMSERELVSYINSLSSSGADQSIHGRYGMGAKIAGLTKNSAGLLYLSWKNGIGSMIHAWKDKSGKYGLKAMPGNHGSQEFVLPLSAAAKPSMIKDHGTIVVLLGMHKNDKTIYAPEGVPNASRWITYYLNSRYFDLSDHPSLYAPYDLNTSVARRVTGMKKFLDGHAETSGTVKLSGASAHWWVLRVVGDNPQIPHKGHVAALYGNELYEMTKAGKPSITSLQHFGVYYGASRVTIYIEPDVEKTTVTTDTARTKLFVNGDPLPWTDWADEFSAKMPADLRRFIESQSSLGQENQQSLEERLKMVADLLKIKRYRPDEDGHHEVQSFIGGASSTSHSDSDSDEKKKKKKVKAEEEKKKTNDGNRDFYAANKKLHGDRTDTTDLPVPTVLWQSEQECQLLDRAARYIANKNTLIVNRDFRVIKDMVDRRTADHKSKPGAAQAAQDSVESWFSLCLAEAVLGINALFGSEEWSSKDMEVALSEEALTAIVMHRYHIVNAVKKDLGTKFGAAAKIGRIEGATSREQISPPPTVDLRVVGDRKAKVACL